MGQTQGTSKSFTVLPASQVAGTNLDLEFVGGEELKRGYWKISSKRVFIDPASSSHLKSVLPARLINETALLLLGELGRLPELHVYQLFP